MKRFLFVAIALFAIVALFVAAPALSLRPYQPTPEQFSMPAPDSGAGTAAALHAPKRFNMLGLTWSGGGTPGIEVRTRLDGGDWSGWAPVETASDRPDPGSEADGHGVTAPVWVGSADWIQYRLTKPVTGMRVSFVNTRGDATAADRMRNGLRGVANAAVLSLAGIARTPTAHAADGRPAMVSRAQWGASACVPRAKPLYGQVKMAFVHHTDNLNDYTRAEAPEVVLAICLFHRNTNKWNDIGYNFLVDRFGTIYEGRAGGTDLPVVGAQAQGFNSGSTGIANLGTFTDVKQTPEALAAIARLIKWKLPLSGVPTTGSTTLTSAGGPSSNYKAGVNVKLARVSGHRDVDATDCPGDALYAQLPELRRLVGSHPAAATATKLSAAPTARTRTVAYGKAARVNGKLTAGSAGAAGQTVFLEALVGKRWTRAATARTGSGGTFSILLRPRNSRSLRVRFAATSSLAAAFSKVFTVGMAPKFAFTAAPSAGARGRTLVISGRVAPRLARVYRVLQVRRGRGWKTVGVKTLKVDRKRGFRNAFKPDAAGTYRYYAEARRSATNALSRSRKVSLRVAGSRGGGARSAHR